MLDNRKNPWYYLIPLVLGFIIGGIAGWLLGNHPVAGGFIGWAAATAYFLWKGGPSKPTGSANSFALPLLLALHVTLSGWWLLALLVAAVWVWACTRKEEGGGYLRGIDTAFAMLGAAIFTVALLIGVGAAWLLK